MDSFCLIHKQHIYIRKQFIYFAIPDFFRIPSQIKRNRNILPLLQSFHKLQIFPMISVSFVSCYMDVSGFRHFFQVYILNIYLCISTLISQKSSILFICETQRNSCSCFFTFAYKSGVDIFFFKFLQYKFTVQIVSDYALKCAMHSKSAKSKCEKGCAASHKSFHRINKFFLSRTW